MSAGPFDLAELAHTPLLLPAQGDACQLKIMQYLHSQGVRVYAAQHIEEDSVTMDVAQHQLGVGIMSALTAQPLLPGLQVLSLPTALEREFGLSVLAARTSLPLLRALVAVTCETTNRMFNLPVGQLYPAM